MKKLSPRGWRHLSYIIELAGEGAGPELRSAHWSLFQNSSPLQKASSQCLHPNPKGRFTLLQDQSRKYFFHYFNYYHSVPSKWHVWKQLYYNLQFEGFVISQITITPYLFTDTFWTLDTFRLRKPKRKSTPIVNWASTKFKWHTQWHLEWHELIPEKNLCFLATSSVLPKGHFEGKVQSMEGSNVFFFKRPFCM